MWQELKRLAGWLRKENEILGVWNEEKREVWGEDALKVWENSFRRLGIEDIEDNKFDKDFGQEILKENEELRMISEKEENENKELDGEIEAIELVQTRKAAGVDEHRRSDQERRGRTKICSFEISAEGVGTGKDSGGLGTGDCFPNFQRWRSERHTKLPRHYSVKHRWESVHPCAEHPS